MGKKILTLIMFAVLMLPIGCKYDDTDLWNSVNNLDERVGNLEAQVKSLNDNVKILSDLMNGKLFIQSVEDQGNGVKVVHFIGTNGEQTTIEIKDGKDGLNGQDGKDGANGADGKDGLNGQDGKDGANGQDGKDGANGQDGKDGANGQDGKDGANGADGKDGKDGATPVVSIRQDSDGNWYWTVNGEYILDAAGNKIRANGIDGKDGAQGPQGEKGETGATGPQGPQGETGATGPQGPQGETGATGPQGPQGETGATGAQGEKGDKGDQGETGAAGQDGKDGADGIAPTFRINEKGNWEISFDQGLTWQECGKATGTDGDSFFKAASTSADGKYAYLTLQDGTVLTFAIYNKFDISFDIAKVILQEGQTREISFTVTGMTPKTQVEVLGKNGWEADAELESNGSGTITVTAPDKTGYGKVIVLCSDGEDKTIMRTLTFLAGTTKSSTTSAEVPTAGGVQTLSVETNLDFTVVIPEAAKSWVSLVETSRAATATHTETFQVKVEPSDLPSPRTALLRLEAEDGTLLETILIAQTPTALAPENLVFRVDPASSTNSKGVILPINTVSGTVTIDWGDGNETTYTAANPSHIYEDKSHEYNVIVKGIVTKINGTSTAYYAGVKSLAQWGTANKYTAVTLTGTPFTFLPGAKGTEFASCTAFSFKSNSQLVDIHSDLFNGATNLKTLANVFQYCTALETVPAGLFNGLTAVTSVGSVFAGCTKFNTIPEGLFKDLASVTSATYMFQNCENLKSVPAGAFTGLDKVTSIDRIFDGCTNLTTIHENAFAPFTKVTTAQRVFNNCKSLTKVPAGLFKTMTAWTNPSYLFAYCEKLSSVPEDLFANQKFTTLQYIFDYCPSIATVPEKLFQNSKTSCTSLCYTFEYCGIKTVPAKLFDGFTKVTNLSYMFRNCDQLEEIPAGFFDFAEQVTNVINIFDGCKSLKKLGSGFVNNDKWTSTSNMSVSAMFRGCESLTSLPEVLFPEKWMLQLNSVNGWFQDCKSLETIPASYFEHFGQGKNGANIREFNNFSMVFYNCAKLKTLPFEAIFNSPAGLRVYNFGSMLEGCAALTGKLPTYALTVGDKTYDVAIWQRVDYIKSSDTEISTAAKAVFGTRTSYSMSDMVKGATKITDWAKMPSAIGGGNDGLTGKPELRVEFVPIEGKEYYAFNIDLYGKEVANETLYYYLGTTADIKKYLPKYNNSLEQMVRDNGRRVTDNWQYEWYTALNSETGAGLTFDQGDPETEYGIIILVSNVRGYSVSYNTYKTGAMPRGSEEYEAYCGTWTVTPAETKCEFTEAMLEQDENGEYIVPETPAPSFEITIEPWRVDSAYNVRGWGYTKFADHNLHADFNKENGEIEFWTAQRGNVQVMTNYPFTKEDNEAARYNTWTVTYYGYIENPETYNLDYWYGANEIFVAGKLNTSGNRATLVGQKAIDASKGAYGDVNWAGFEVILTMGSMGGSQYWTPVQIVKPEYVYNHKGIDLTLHHQGPYKMERKSTAATAAKAKKAAAAKTVAGIKGYTLTQR